MLMCGQQSIALWGHRDDSTAPDSSNKGNFLAIVNYGIRWGNVEMANHLRDAGTTTQMIL